MLWRPEQKKDLVEVGGPMKRVRPRGLVLVAPENRSSDEDSSIIECGRCHKVIYRADEGFDSDAFQQAKKAHYSNSPECEQHK
jgi:hypothetical protein